MTVSNQTTGGKILAHLAGYDLKELSGNRYRSRSPLRPESDSRSFSLFLHADGEHGMYKDHVSGGGGSLYQLAKQLGIETPANDSSATSKRAYASLSDYASSHGVAVKVFEQAGWREGTLGSRRVAFFKTNNGERWRFLDGGQPKYGNRNGYKQCWYGLKKAIAMLAGSAFRVLVLCNGEASTIVAQHHGLAACCITNSGERSDLSPELLTELNEYLDVPDLKFLVAFDCDDKGRAAAVPMANYLCSQGLDARAVDLDLGFAGADLADWCKLYGIEALDQLMRCPTATVPTQQMLDLSGDYQAVALWKGYDITELDSLPKVSWLIANEIVDSEINVLYGLPGSGKSFKALDYTMRIARDAGSVIYLAYEGESGYLARALAWCEYHKVPLDTYKGKIHFIMGHLELMEKDDFTSLAQIVRQMSPRLIVIDTLGRAMTGLDAKEGKDVNLFMKMCARLKTVFNCAILLVHHSNKAGKEEYGSVYLRASAASAILIADDDGLIIIESIKTKDGAKFQSYLQRLLPVTTIHKGETYNSAVLLDAKRVIQTAQDPLSPNQSRLLSLLALDIYTDGLSPKDIKAESDITLSSVPRTLSRLLAMGCIAKIGWGVDVSYKITDLGRAKVAESSESGESPESGESLESGDSLKLKIHTPDSGDSPDSPDSGDSAFERYIMDEFGAEIEPPPSQAAFIQPRAKYD